MRPTISICIPAYNAERYLRQSLDSALAQTFGDCEVVLVDNASTDDTFTIAEEYSRRDPRLRVYRNRQNLGVLGNWNRCIDLAQGEWLKFLCADDWLEPTCLARMLDVVRSDVWLVLCRERLSFSEDISDAEKKEHQKYWAEHSLLPRRFPGQSFISAPDFARLVAEDSTFNCTGAPNAIMIHRSALERFGRRDPRLITHDDWELCARVAIHTGLCYLDDALANFRQHYNALSITEVARNRFNMEVIAPLIIRHQVAYAPVYAPVREAALRCRPPIDLEYELFEAVREAQRLVDQFADDPSRPDPQARAEWQETLKHFPRLLSVPPGYFFSKNWGRVKRGFRRLAAVSG
jgi:GT2 family glycosyltransferase